MATLKGAPGQSYQVGNGRRYVADDATGLIRADDLNDRFDLVRMGCELVPAAQTPPSSEVRSVESPVAREPAKPASERDVLGFVDEYQRSTARPSQRGLLQRRTDLRFPATDQQIKAAAKARGVYGSRGRSRKVARE